MVPTWADGAQDDCQGLELLLERGPLISSAGWGDHQPPWSPQSVSQESDPGYPQRGELRPRSVEKLEEGCKEMCERQARAILHHKLLEP